MSHVKVEIDREWQYEIINFMLTNLIVIIIITTCRLPCLRGEPFGMHQFHIQVRFEEPYESVRLQQALDPFLSLIECALCWLSHLGH